MKCYLSVSSLLKLPLFLARKFLFLARVARVKFHKAETKALLTQRTSTGLNTNHIKKEKKKAYSAYLLSVLSETALGPELPWPSEALAHISILSFLTLNIHHHLNFATSRWIWLNLTSLGPRLLQSQRTYLMTWCRCFTSPKGASYTRGLRGVSATLSQGSCPLSATEPWVLSVSTPRELGTLLITQPWAAQRLENHRVMWSGPEGLLCDCFIPQGASCLELKNEGGVFLGEADFQQIPFLCVYKKVHCNIICKRK